MKKNKVTTKQIDDISDSAKTVYRYNNFEKDKNGDYYTKNNGNNMSFTTGLFSSKGEEIFGWFERKDTSWNGVEWLTKCELEKKIYLSGHFCLSEISFDIWADGEKFINKLAKTALEEPWDIVGDDQSYSILKSYISHIFEAIKQSKNKKTLLVNKDGSKAVFNTNLLDSFASDIFVVVEIKNLKEGAFVYANPQIVDGDEELNDLGFKSSPEPPCFFDKLEDIFYNPDWKVATSISTYTHIIKARNFRFPEKYKNEPDATLGSLLKNAITFAQNIAKRNYKFIVPMYRPQNEEGKRIQMLMPIYLGNNYADGPDFALILTPDKSKKNVYAGNNY